MKKIISFTISFLMINTCMANNKRHDCDIINAENKIFSCLDDAAGDFEYTNGVRVQIVGLVYCKTTPITTRSMTCNDDDDDYWLFSSAHWRPDTLHENAVDPNALYYLYDKDKNKVNTKPVAYNSSENYFAYNGTVQAVCKEGYTSDTTKCVTIESVATCKTKGNQAPGIECSTDGGKKCLQTGTGAYLYCYSKSEYANQKIHDFQNSCVPTHHMVTTEKKPGIYFTCKHDGVWQEEKFDRCKEGDEFPTGCNGIPNCIEDVYDTNSLTSYTGTQVFDTTQIPSLCARSICDDGYQKQDDKCVSDSVIEEQKKQKEKEEEIQNAKKEKCERTLGKWNVSKCTCTVPDTVLEGDKCVCKNKAYELDTTNGQCELKSEHKPKKEACENSHGTWDKDHCVCDKSKILILNSDGVCVCDGADYEYNPEQQKCVLTDIAKKRNACNAASDTKWIESEKQCKCTKSGTEWNGTMCVYSEDYLKCDKVSDAEWNEKENKCVCVSDEKEIKDGKCVDAPSTIAKREIDTSFPRFQELIADLEVNKWKSADGTFNVARLASDSIAGAVLGTATGLITGSIIKKNQVKKGFENVRCVVGNQVVAGYGDEFTVDAQ